MPSEARDSGTRRLHPLSLLFIIGSLVWSLLVPGIVFLVFASKGRNAELWVMLAFVPAVAGALLKYFSYRYRLAGEELVIREGIIFRNERHIPYARIQNIDCVQNPLHRMLGVAEVRLETAGGDKPEAVIRVLSLGAVERMRSRVFADRADKHAGATTVESAAPATARDSGERLLHSMPTREVVLFGLISNKGMLVVAAVMGLIWQTDLADRWLESIDREKLERAEELLPLDDYVAAVLLGLAALVTLLVLMRVLSVAWALFQLYGFRLQRFGEDLRAVYGLWRRVSKTIPRHRIQVLSTREGPLHRWAGRVVVQVETAGSVSKEEGSGGGSRLWLAPLIRKERLPALLAEALPGVELADVHWERVSPRAYRRLLRRGAYLLVPLGALSVWGLGPAGLAVVVPLGALFYLNARLTVKHTAYALVERAMFFRSGWWVRRMSVTRFSKIQSLETSASPFDRRHGMASLRLDTAGATRVGHGIDVPFLDTDIAAQLLRRLSAEAARTAFRW